MVPANCRVLDAKKGLALIAHVICDVARVCPAPMLLVCVAHDGAPVGLKGPYKGVHRICFGA